VVGTRWQKALSLFGMGSTPSQQPHCAMVFCLDNLLPGPRPTMSWFFLHSLRYSTILRFLMTHRAVYPSVPSALTPHSKLLLSAQAKLGSSVTTGAGVGGTIGAGVGGASGAGVVGTRWQKALSLLGMGSTPSQQPHCAMVFCLDNLLPGPRPTMSWLLLDFSERTELAVVVLLVRRTSFARTRTSRFLSAGRLRRQVSDAVQR
jgi:hypothetical protein